MANRIVVVGNSLRIKELNIEDETIAKYFKKSKGDDEQLASELRKVIRVGILTLSEESIATLIGKLESELNVKLSSLKEQILIEEKLGAVEKGKNFETEIIPPLIEKFAKIFDDTVIPVGNEEGSIPGSKKGDILVIINPKETFGVETKVVFEAKDKTMNLGGEGGILKELEEARINREAASAVAVFSAESAPKEVGALRYYPPYGLICTIDKEKLDTLPLEVAYKYARYEAIMQIKKEEVKIDVKKVKDLMTTAISTLRTFSSIKSKITSSINNLEDIKTTLDDLHHRMNDIFEEIEEELK